MMAMILHPEIQKKAQAELDTVLGKERLPLISDRQNLPYIRSIMAETLRWAPSAPLGASCIFFIFGGPQYCLLVP
jgi:cytochrome P450